MSEHAPSFHPDHALPATTQATLEIPETAIYEQVAGEVETPPELPEQITGIRHDIETWRHSAGIAKAERIAQKEAIRSVVAREAHTDIAPASDKDSINLAKIGSIIRTVDGLVIAPHGDYEKEVAA